MTPTGRDTHRGAVTGVGVITTEELDELARQVRGGVFATIDEAVAARDQAARAQYDRDTPGPLVCRVDHRFGQAGAASVVIDPDTERGCGAAERDVLANAEPPPPF